eukprot:TRINITY_DN5365_c0_g1_i3.p1 TRINITY_DN5365_c0_g1~~TRINITY_DN5365_c0_g1_i3.p1  ORF type:complete len:110 (-),score=23.48 TRINITY_DN5365_c0_g1_i3:247-576(-)
MNVLLRNARKPKGKHKNNHKTSHHTANEWQKPSCYTTVRGYSNDRKPMNAKRTNTTQRCNITNGRAGSACHCHCHCYQQQQPPQQQQQPPQQQQQQQQQHRLYNHMHSS